MNALRVILAKKMEMSLWKRKLNARWNLRSSLRNVTIICKCHNQNLSFYHFINFSRCVDHYNDHFQGTHNINDKIKCIVEDCGEFLAKKHFRDKTREDLEYIREIVEMNEEQQRSQD